MPDGRLYLGTRRYSSWSMRGWLAVRLAGLDVEEVVIPLNAMEAGGTPAVAAASPSGMVPYLEHCGIAVWESLAIVEYCADLSPNLWPADPAGRAHAQSISAEMHAGFRALRMAMPMVLGPQAPGACQTPRALRDIARIEAVWRGTRAAFGTGGPFLFGPQFNAADAMFTPVVTRLLTYLPPIAPDTQAYCDAVRAHPLVDAWHQAAAAEPPEWLRASDERPFTHP